MMNDSNIRIVVSDDIAKAIKSIEFMYPDSYLTQYAPNHVFDEEKTVKWNREEVIRKNAENKLKVENERKLKAQAYEALQEAVIRYIQNYSSDVVFTRAAAEKIIEAAKDQRDDSWHIWLDDFIDLAVSVILAQK